MCCDCNRMKIVGSYKTARSLNLYLLSLARRNLNLAHAFFQCMVTGDAVTAQCTQGRPLHARRPST